MVVDYLLKHELQKRLYLLSCFRVTVSNNDSVSLSHPSVIHFPLPLYRIP